MTGSPGHRLLPHTADMGIEAWADEPEQLFIEAALGLKQMIFGEVRFDGRVEQSVQLEANDGPELMVAWLNEVLYHLETSELVPVSFRVLSLDNHHLEAVIRGAPAETLNHPVEREVKAVTYHQPVMERRPEGWYARVYVDL